MATPRPAEVPCEGYVAPGFERVREAFLANFSPQAADPELGASFAVLRGDEPLVDLRAGYADRKCQRPWSRDSIVNVWSAGKGVVALCIAALVEDGLLDYESPVSAWWPEFGAWGKESLSVAMLMSHQAGLSALRRPTRIQDFYDHEGIIEALVGQEPLFPPGEACGYHAMTLGHLASELVRRVTGGSTLGEFWRARVAEPLGIDFWIGLPEQEDARVVETVAPRDQPDIAGLAGNPVQHLAFSNPFPEPELPNDRAWRAAEVPAANGHGHAASLAQVYALLAAGGSYAGRRVLSPETVAAATRARIEDRDLVLGMEVEWAAGFLRNRRARLYGPNPASFGHAGYGGSVGFGDPEAGVGVGYATNQLSARIVGDERTLRLIDALYGCLAHSK